MTKSFQKISVVTGTRAEYGLLFWILREIESEPSLDLQLVVSGTHLSAEFGNTVETIRKDGFLISAEVPCISDDDSFVGMGRDFAKASLGFVDAFAKLKPDLVILLGDRFECLAAACSASILRIPIAHIHGGEVTEGALDESFRHAITKLSHLHFAAAQEYADRIIRMGENPQRVHNVGAVGLEHFSRLDLLSRMNLSENLNFDLTHEYALVTYHPVTLGDFDPTIPLSELIEAMRATDDLRYIVTMANADAGGRRINEEWRRRAGDFQERLYLSESLGQLRYLSAMKHATCVIGNSSSGIIETPAIGVPTVNIGARQAGRLKALSVIDCEEVASDIQTAIKTARSKSFMSKIKDQKPPYGKPRRVAAKIMNRILQMEPSHFREKPFFDLEECDGIKKVV